MLKSCNKTISKDLGKWGTDLDEIQTKIPESIEGFKKYWITKWVQVTLISFHLMSLSLQEIHQSK